MRNGGIIIYVKDHINCTQINFNILGGDSLLIKLSVRRSVFLAILAVELQSEFATIIQSGRY